MIHTRLYNFIKSNLDDEYVMSVLYYSVRKAVVDNDFNLKEASQIILSHKFLEEPVSINIRKIFDSKEKTMALLLSLRAATTNCFSNPIQIKDLCGLNTPHL